MFQNASIQNVQQYVSESAFFEVAMQHLNVKVRICSENRVKPSTQFVKIRF